MGKNENRLLSAISPLYALSQGKLPGILGVGMSVIEDRKDKKEEEKMLRGQTTSQERRCSWSSYSDENRRTS
jgi:hypothetical protein